MNARALLLVGLVLSLPGRGFAQEPTPSPEPTASPAAPEASPIATATPEPSPIATATATPSAEPTATPVAPRPIEQLDLDDLLAMPVVFSASQLEEPTREAPVPVTVITREMIRSTGARNLQDLLITLVPGMTFVADHNELNVAMRGVYASSQQKILVLLDGHRLNSRAYSMANPDFSIGLDHIKHIEVLRGPGSSLYGNVALAGVINIVTLSGEEADGFTFRVGGGDFGQETARLTFGQKLGERSDVLLWGHYYKADGQRLQIPAEEDFAPTPAGGYTIVGGARDPASYDIGVKVRAGDFQMLASTRHGKHIDPFTSGGAGTGLVYDYDAVRTFRGIGPGISMRFTHLELKHTRAFLREKLTLDSTVYYDTSEMQGVLTTNPNGGALYLGWNDDGAGGIVQGRYAFETPVGEGNFTLGGQVDRMRVIDSGLAAQVGGEWSQFSDTDAQRVVDIGGETIYSAFAQLKQELTSQFIVNAGVRFDDKDRHEGENVTDVSPRVALIYTPTESIDVKLSYAQSFVDAPYWYRYNSLAAYQGSSGLKPEHLRSVQLTPSFALFGGKLRSTTNLFYNHLYDFVFRNNNPAPGEVPYQNAGILRTMGAEQEIAFLQPFYRVRANATYQHLIEGKNYGTSDDRINNVPQTVGNLSLDVNPLYAFYRKSWVNLTVRYVGEQLSPINLRFATTTGTRAWSYPDNEVNDYVLVNAGVRVDDVVLKGLSFDATLYNALDQEYAQGGSVVHPYPQPGRWFLGTLTYHFRP